MSRNGKTAAILLSGLTLGFGIGYLGSSSNAHGSKRQPEERAVTMVGADGYLTEDEATLAGERRTEARHYPESELRKLVKDGLITGDIMVFFALEEWNRGEDGSGILAEFESGDPEIAWYRLSHWSADFPEAAARMAMNNFSHSTEQEALHDSIVMGGVSYLLRTDPGAAVDMARAFRRRGPKDSYLNLTGRLSEWEPEEIERAAGRIKEVEKILGINSTRFFEDWIYRFPEDALQWQLEHVNPHDIEGESGWVMKEWAKQDFSGALEFVEESLQAPVVDFKDLRRLVREVPPGKVKELAAWLRTQDLEMVRKVLKNTQTESDPFGEGSSLIDPLLAEMGSEYFAEASSPEEASRSNKQLPTPSTWPPASVDEVRGLLEIQDDPFRERERFVEEWTVESVNEAIASLGEYAHEFTPTKAAGIARAWAYGDPVAAMQWASDLAPEMQIETAESALNVWFSRDREAALNYVESLPDIEFKRYAVEKVSREWLRTSPDKAVVWIESLPPGFNRDIGLGQAATRFRKGEPARAFAHANEIQNPVLRDMAIEEVFTTWRQSDSSTAIKILQQANLPTERIRELRTAE